MTFKISNLANQPKNPHQFFLNIFNSSSYQKKEFLRDKIMTNRNIDIICHLKEGSCQ